MGNPIKMDDLGVPLFLETPIFEIIWDHNNPHLQDIWIQIRLWR